MAAQSAQCAAYYRVLTERQGESGLGLAAQQEAVSRFFGFGRGYSFLLAEFTEIESGKRHINCPELLRAIELSRRQRVTLVIAKLDRLARNLYFISGLMETGVEFIAADMPQANQLTIHILAAFAEHEREAISQRTKGVLQAARKRSIRFGNTRGLSPSPRHGKSKIPFHPAAGRDDAPASCRGYNFTSHRRSAPWTGDWNYERPKDRSDMQGRYGRLLGFK